MAEIITCPSCKKTLQIPEQYFEQTVQCPQCGHQFVPISTSVTASPKPTAAPEPAASSAPKKRWDEPDDPPPRPRRFDDDYDDDYDIGPARRIRSNLPPHRGGLIMALGLVSLIGGWLFCLPIVVGPVAWILAQIDLRAIRAGEMDPTGESMVRTGQVCGIISTVILVGGILVIAALSLLTL